MTLGRPPSHAAPQAMGHPAAHAAFPDDLVVWSADEENERRITKIDTQRIRDELVAGSDDVLKARYSLKAGSETRNITLLDLAIHFSHAELAAELAAYGVDASHVPDAVASVTTVDQEEVRGMVGAAVAACRASADAARRLWAPGPGGATLLDIAILVGERESATALRDLGAPRSRELLFEDFVRDPTRDARKSPLVAKFHWALRGPAIVAALGVGCELKGLTASPNLRFGLKHGVSLLDAAILGGYPKEAAALSKAGVESRLTHVSTKPGPKECSSLLGMMVLEEPRYFLDKEAVVAALAAGLRLEAMQLSVLQIKFAYPMKKFTSNFELLDVAICLGQEDLAELAAAESVKQRGVLVNSCSLVESHLNGTDTLIPRPPWRKDNMDSFPTNNTPRRFAAAAAAAAVFDQARATAWLDHVILLSQWGRPLFHTKEATGLSHTIVPRLIYEYAMPRTLLTLSRIQDFINSAAVVKRQGSAALQLEVTASPSSNARRVMNCFV